MYKSNPWIPVFKEEVQCMLENNIVSSDVSSLNGENYSKLVKDIVNSLLGDDALNQYITDSIYQTICEHLDAGGMEYE